MDAAALLEKARREKNPDQKYALLLEAEAYGADDLALQREFLLLGDVQDYPAGDPRRMSCYAFHGFEHPESHPEDELEHIAQGLFHHPRLEKCLALAQDREAFLREYLMALSERYIRIFIREDRSHIPFLFGYVSLKKLPRYLAPPMGDVIRNIFLCPFLSLDQQSLVAGCFYRTCYQYLGGRTAPLDEYLGAEICALIR